MREVAAEAAYERDGEVRLLAHAVQVRQAVEHRADQTGRHQKLILKMKKKNGIILQLTLNYYNVIIMSVVIVTPTLFMIHSKAV